MTMSSKKNKAKKSSVIKSEATGSLRWPWSELHQNLTKSRLTERYFHYTTSQGITKSWPTTSRRCKSTQQHCYRRRLYHVVNDGSSKNSSTWGPYNRYFSNESCIMALYDESNALHWCILGADTTGDPHQPSSRPLCGGTHPCCTVSSYLEHPIIVDVVNLVGNIPTSALMVNYRISHERYWCCNKYIRHECVTIDPFDAKKKYMEFTSMVRYEDKVYAMSLQGTLVVMQDVDLRLRITDMSKRRAVPYVSSRFFKEYLLELEGEIILVFLIHQNSREIVDRVEVFRLCLVKLEWFKVERLQGKTLFLGQRCIWANSAEIGCGGNCVYFTQGSDNGWWMYDMNSGCILRA